MTSLIPGGRQELVRIEEYQGKLEAALAARADSGMMVMARTEALVAGADLNEALKRGEAYADAGAEALLVHSKGPTRAEIVTFHRRVAGQGSRGRRAYAFPEFSREDARRSGRWACPIYANHAIRASVAAMRAAFRAIPRGRRGPGGRRDDRARVYEVQASRTWKGGNETRPCTIFVEMKHPAAPPKPKAKPDRDPGPPSDAAALSARLEAIAEAGGGDAARRVEAIEITMTCSSPGIARWRRRGAAWPTARASAMRVAQDLAAATDAVVIALWGFAWRHVLGPTRPRADGWRWWPSAVTAARCWRIVLRTWTFYSCGRGRKPRRARAWPENALCPVGSSAPRSATPRAPWRAT